MTAATTTPPPTENQQPRRDAVTWVLTAVTTAVLLVGVLVIRSTRPQAPPKGPDNRPDLAEVETRRETEPTARQRVIVALPEEAPAGGTPPAQGPPSTAGRLGPGMTDRR